MPTQPVVTTMIPVDEIASSRHQARKSFEEESIKQLATSIEKEDLLQPITVRKVGDGYELIAGERRLRAVKSLGWPTIEARVIEVASEAAACAKGLIENLQREDFNPIEEAEGLSALNTLDPGYWTQVRIAEITGKSQGHISETLRLLSLSDKVKDNIRRRIFTPQHGAELLRLPTPKLQDKVAETIEKKGLLVKQTRDLVNKVLAKGAASPEKESPSPSGRGTAQAQGEAGSQTFQFKLSDSDILGTFRIPKSGNLEDELAKLKAALLLWLKAHQGRLWGQSQEVDLKASLGTVPRSDPRPPFAPPQPSGTPAPSSGVSDTLKEGAAQAVTDLAKDLLRGLF
jgi:ParB family chromosome partitioning protein